MHERVHLAERADPERGLAPAAPRQSLQRKLIVGRADDALEREADLIAHDVLRARTNTASLVADDSVPTRIRRAPSRPPATAGAAGGDVDDASRIRRSSDVRRGEELRPTTGPVLAHELVHTVHQAPRRTVIRRGRSDDRVVDPHKDERRDWRDRQRKKGATQRERQRRRETRQDADQDYPYGRELVTHGRRQRAAERSKQRAEEREREAQDEALWEQVEASAERERAERTDVLEVDVPDAWSTRTVAGITAFDAALALFAPSLQDPWTRVELLRTYAAPDPGGQLDTHRATIQALQNETATKRQWCTTAQAQARAGFRLSTGQRFELARLLESHQARLDAMTGERDTAVAYITPIWNTNQAAITQIRALKNLRLPDVATVADPTEGVLLIGVPALQRLSQQIGFANVQRWESKPWPHTRARPPGVGPDLYMPVIELEVKNVAPAVAAAGTVRLRLSPEIVVDWMFPNPAHGLKCDELWSRAQKVLDTKNRDYQIFQPQVVPSHGGKWKVESGNYKFQLILNPAQDTIVTYYMT
jgi:hypothetical protein